MNVEDSRTAILARLGTPSFCCAYSGFPLLRLFLQARQELCWNLISIVLDGAYLVSHNPTAVTSVKGFPVLRHDLV